MAAKKKTKKKPTKRAALRKMTPKKKVAKKSVQKKAAGKKAASKTTSGAKKAAGPKKQSRAKGQTVDPAEFLLRGTGSRSGRQAGDLQGLSDIEAADSESVDELIEEGNAFEADAVAGVEEADNADEKEVHTHEVPEDDVPEEYLDEN